MKSLLVVAAVITVAVAGPVQRGLVVPEGAGPVPAPVIMPEPIAIGPAIVDFEPVAIGPAIIDFEPVAIGPAIIDAFEPVAIGPAIIDSPVLEDASVVEAASKPTVQIILNINLDALNAGVATPEVAEEIAPEPVQIVESAPEPVQVVEIAPMPVHPVQVVEVAPAPVEPVIIGTPVLPSPVVTLPEELN